MASPNLNEITTTTLRNRSGKLADNVTKNNALLRRLQEKNRIRKVTGGRTIVQEIEYAANSTVKRYSGYETLNIAPSDVMTAAEFNYAQYAVAVSISGLEMLQNTGKWQVIDMLEARISNAERSLMNTISTDCYSDGTADGGKAIGGLQLCVADAGTGTVGGIDSSSFTFWKNIKFGGVADGGAAVSASNIQDYMHRLYMPLVRGTDRPDLIMADNNYYRYYLESLTAIQRIASDSSASAGFMSLKYMDADVVFDGGFQGASGGAPSNHMYFLNSDYIYFRPHSERNFVPLDPERFSVNQDAMVKLIGWAGNMTVSNRSLLGVLVA